MKTSTHIKVRGYHLDGYGHVNNARYLEFLEEARWDFIEKTGGVAYFTRQGLIFVVVRIEIDYRFPAKAEDELLVSTGYHSHGNSSLTLIQEMCLSDSGRVVVQALVKFVLLDRDSGRPQPVTEEYVDHFKGKHVGSA